MPVRSIQPKLIAIVIPAFNEQDNIVSVLAQIHALRAEHKNWTLLPIVVNDGSSDHTAQVLEQHAARYQAQWVDLPVNLGIGKTVQTGFRLAVQMRADVVLQLDGDGQHPAREIPKIVEPILREAVQVVVGSRYVPGYEHNVSSQARALGTKLFSVLIQTLTGVKIYDTTSGFRAFSNEAAQFVAQHYPDDYPEVEAYIPLARQGFKILEVPVQMKPRQGGSSSIFGFRVAYYMLKVTLATLVSQFKATPFKAYKAPLERPVVVKGKDQAA